MQYDAGSISGGDFCSADGEGNLYPRGLVIHRHQRGCTVDALILVHDQELDGIQSLQIASIPGAELPLGDGFIYILANQVPGLWV